MRTPKLVAAGIVAVFAMSDASHALQNRGNPRGAQAAPRAALVAPRAQSAPRAASSRAQAQPMRQAQQAAPRVVAPQVIRPVAAPQQDASSKAQAAKRRAAIMTQSAVKTASAKSKPVARPPAPPTRPAGMASPRSFPDTRTPEQKALYKARAAKQLEQLAPWQMRAMTRNQLAAAADEARRTGHFDHAARAAHKRAQAKRDAKLAAVQDFYQQRAAERLAEMEPWQVAAARRNELAKRADAAQRTGKMDKVVLAKTRRRELEQAAAAVPPEPHVPNSLTPQRLGGEVRFSQPHPIYRARAQASGKKNNAAGN